MSDHEMTIDERRRRGISIFADQYDMGADEVARHLEDSFGPNMAREALIGMAAAWSDEPLSMRDRSLIVIACLVTQGGAEARLRSHVGWAIRNGATREELDALMTLLGVYAGYPRASTGMQVLREELGAGDGAN